MKHVLKPFYMLLALCTLVAFALPAAAETVTNDVYGPEPVVADINVKVTPGDKKLTVTFSKVISEDETPVLFGFNLKVANTEHYSDEITFSTNRFSSDTVTYTYKDLKNDRTYDLLVTAYNEKEQLIGQGKVSGTPVAAKPKIDVNAMAGNAQVTLNFVKLKGIAPTTYVIEWWSKTDKDGKPIYEKPITIKAETVKDSTHKYVFKKLKNGTTYHFNIYAKKGDEILAMTSDVKVTLKAPAKKK